MATIKGRNGSAQTEIEEQARDARSLEKLLESGRVHVLPVSVTTLRTLVIFSSLETQRLYDLLPYCRLLAVPSRHTVMREGEDTRNTYVLLSGQLRVMHTENNRDTVLSTLYPGEVFGEMGDLDNHPRSATIESTMPSRILGMACHAFQKCIAENFDVSMFVIRGLIRRLRDADRRITSLAAYDVSGRLARYLIDAAAKAKARGAPLEVQASQSDIANEIGATREMVAKCLRKMADEELIRVARKRIIINGISKE